MRRSARLLAVTAALLPAFACSDPPTSTVAVAPWFTPAFSQTPAGFGNVNSTYVGGDEDAFVGEFGPGDDMGGPRRRGGGPEGGGRHGHPPRHGGPPPQGGPRHGEHGRGPGFDGLMGGGIIHGLDGFGGRFGGPDLTNCTLGSDGRVACPDLTRGDLTISRSFAFTSETGAAQAHPDSATTDIVNAHTVVSGTITHRNGVTSTVNHESDRTVSGLRPASSARTLNATSAGSEEATFDTDMGPVTISHTASDAVTGVVIPKPTDGSHPYPIAGKVERQMAVRIVRAGVPPETHSRSEVLTYDGSATASLVITFDGGTKSCSLPLPHGRPVCQ